MVLGKLDPFVEQILAYNVGSALVSAGLGPYLAELTSLVNQTSPLVPLSPEVAAEIVIRNVWDRDRAATEASRSGVNADRFAALVELAGNAPDPQSLAVALRRKLIDQATYTRGIRQGRLRDEWADLVQRLAVQQPSPVAMLDAYLEGQLTEGEARAKYAELGGDPDYFDVLYHTQGQAPSPVQAADMANRGIIPWTGEGPDAVSFRQAFLEGPWRNKWEAPMREAAAYLPPPRTVTAMYNEGSIDRATAIGLLTKQGLTPELAAAYVASGSAQKTQAARDLSVSTIETLYRDRLIDQATATGMLEALGYDATESGFLLAVVDLQVVQRYVSTAVGRVHTLYIGHKLVRAEAQALLVQLAVPPDSVTGLLSTWDLERVANVATLTAAQIASALGSELVDQGTAQGMLQEIGYQPHDAWLYLSIHEKRKLPDEPPADALVTGPGPG